MNVVVQNKEMQFLLSMTQEEINNFNAGVNYFLEKILVNDCSADEMKAINNISRLRDTIVLAMNS